MEVDYDELRELVGDFKLLRKETGALRPQHFRRTPALTKRLIDLSASLDIAKHQDSLVTARDGLIALIEERGLLGPGDQMLIKMALGIGIDDDSGVQARRKALANDRDFHLHSESAIRGNEVRIISLLATELVRTVGELPSGNVTSAPVHGPNVWSNSGDPFLRAALALDAFIKNYEADWSSNRAHYSQAIRRTTAHFVHCADLLSPLCNDNRQLEPFFHPEESGKLIELARQILYGMGVDDLWALGLQIALTESETNRHREPAIQEWIETSSYGQACLRRVEAMVNRSIKDFRFDLAPAWHFIFFIRTALSDEFNAGSQFFA